LPLFEYRCSACAAEFELLIRAKDRAACPNCGESRVERLLSEASAHANRSSLPIASASCPPGDAPCGPGCCRLP
jgi:putative FmdB family regulatory protein